MSDSESKENNYPLIMEIQTSLSKEIDIDDQRDSAIGLNALIIESSNSSSYLQKDKEIFVSGADAEANMQRQSLVVVNSEQLELEAQQKEAI